MKAVISSTRDDQYLFYLPITTWLWNRIGVDVICFMPIDRNPAISAKGMLQDRVLYENNARLKIEMFFCPEYKEATYAQVSRLYGACLDLPDDEVLVTSDIDMALFKIPQNAGSHIAVFGSDLVPTNQLPICYISGAVKEWRSIMRLNYGAGSLYPLESGFELKTKTYQQMLDSLLGEIEAEHFRGNFWAKDQEEAYNNILGGNGHAVLLPRARPGTQFASNRIDRDDAYFVDRLSPDIIDYHMHRPGYLDVNFEKIISVISYFYPNDDLTWMKEYQQQYKQLL